MSTERERNLCRLVSSTFLIVVVLRPFGCCFRLLGFRCSSRERFSAPPFRKLFRLCLSKTKHSKGALDIIRCLLLMMWNVSFIVVEFEWTRAWLLILSTPFAYLLMFYFLSAGKMAVGGCPTWQIYWNAIIQHDVWLKTQASMSKTEGRP